MKTNQGNLSLEDKAQRIFDALNKYYEVYPNRQSGPKVTITQDWEVLLDYEGIPCDSDFEDYVTLFINHYEDEEWWYSMDTIKTAIPIVDKELEGAKKFCLKYLGEIPTHKNNIPPDITFFMSMIVVHIKRALTYEKSNDWVIEIDKRESYVYLIPREKRKSGHRGEIHHFEISDFIMDNPEGKKEINKKKVRDTAEKIALD